MTIDIIKSQSFNERIFIKVCQCSSRSVFSILTRYSIEYEGKRLYSPLYSSVFILNPPNLVNLLLDRVCILNSEQVIYLVIPERTQYASDIVLGDIPTEEEIALRVVLLKPEVGFELDWHSMVINHNETLTVAVSSLEINEAV